jgi:DtxR family Mn-dependent transcriptional regulator
VKYGRKINWVERGLVLVEQNKISPSLEDYLKTIFRLQVTNQPVRITDVAREMQVTKASVNRAVGKLVDQNLLSHQYYGALELTDSGRRVAIAIDERHQLLQYFFSEILGVERLVAERDACAIEHHISTATMAKLIGFLASLTTPSQLRVEYGQKESDDKL